jgi:hypothetical protein
MTRADLIRHCALELGLDKTNGSDEYLLMVDWANDGVVDVLMETRIHLDTGDQALSAGTDDYYQDASILAVDERTIEANTFPIQLVSISDIFEARRGSASSDYVMKLAFEGDLMMVWPTPSSSVVVHYVYVPKPSPMTSDTHDPSVSTYGGIPSWAHPAILSYMLWRGSRYDEKKTPHTPSQYHDFYQLELQKIRKRLKRIAGRSALGMTAGYPGRPSAGRFNDIYPAD